MPCISNLVWSIYYLIGLVLEYVSNRILTKNRVLNNNSSPKTYWLSTGLFPQEFIITLPTPTTITKISLTSFKVGQWVVHASKQFAPTEFEHVSEQNLEETESGLQTYSVPLKSPLNGVRHLKLEVAKAHAPFVSVHRLVVNGDVSQNNAIAVQ